MFSPEPPFSVAAALSPSLPGPENPLPLLACALLYTLYRKRSALARCACANLNAWTYKLRLVHRLKGQDVSGAAKNYGASLRASDRSVSQKMGNFKRYAVLPRLCVILANLQGLP